MNQSIFAGRGRACFFLSTAACVVTIAGCGGGGNDSDSAPAASTNGSQGNATVAGGVVAPAVNPPAAASPATTAGVAGTPATAATASAAGAGTGLAQLSEFTLYKLGAADRTGTATVAGNALTLEGRQYADARLVAGNCSIGGTAFSQCSSVPSQNVFTLCSNDNGTGAGSDKARSRYILFDPKAERITDVAILRNLTFDGYENCGQDNVGAQPKTAPSSTLAFDGSGNLTLTRFDRSPARVDSAPSFLVKIEGETVNGGNSARFIVYRTNGRYLIVATTAPTSGATAADPGTLTAFVQH